MTCKRNLSCAEKLKPVLEHYVGFAQDPLSLYFNEPLEKNEFLYIFDIFESFSVNKFVE